MFIEVWTTLGRDQSLIEPLQGSLCSWPDVILNIKKITFIT